MKDENETTEKTKQEPTAVIKMLREGNAGLERYKHLIGIGVFLMLIAFSGIYWHALSEERKMAENCGFTDGKLKCVCHSEAWTDYLANNELTNSRGFDQDSFESIIEDHFANASKVGE